MTDRKQARAERKAAAQAKFAGRARFGNLHLDDGVVRCRQLKMPVAGAHATFEETRHGVASRRSTFTVTVTGPAGTLTETAETAGSMASIHRTLAERFVN